MVSRICLLGCAAIKGHKQKTAYTFWLPEYGIYNIDDYIKETFQ